MYGLQVLDSWLYDDRLPFIHIEANETFAELRGKVKTGYFEGLVQKYSAGQYPSQRGDLCSRSWDFWKSRSRNSGKRWTGESCQSPEEIENVKETFQKLTEFRRAKTQRKIWRKSSVKTGRYEERGKSAGERSAEHWRYHTFVS